MNEELQCDDRMPSYRTHSGIGGIHIGAVTEAFRPSLYARNGFPCSHISIAAAGLNTTDHASHHRHGFVKSAAFAVDDAGVIAWAAGSTNYDEPAAAALSIRIPGAVRTSEGSRRCRRDDGSDVVSSPSALGRSWAGSGPMN
ncbi:uncharacterized protein GLRG_07967 [Colletotrichum graminicola M1.001]|uniref:Uncharacterized protein n=1 Tax=Colletotrichum graminicola (strain M1.001 / M2 / FGSC 10212) TaxID=645133 RepID=E3QPP6_COLGM|nr:uncharacterized protein GLRG_07967 [Colletotrichum graminicola M1.001]EFQ32823.1 hypothetical protein GLRG_07967 [Colletotrichum graminicola M1.001]